MLNFLWFQMQKHLHKCHDANWSDLNTISKFWLIWDNSLFVVKKCFLFGWISVNSFYYISFAQNLTFQYSNQVQQSVAFSKFCWNLLLLFHQFVISKENNGEFCCAICSCFGHYIRFCSMGFQIWICHGMHQSCTRYHFCTQIFA